MVFSIGILLVVIGGILEGLFSIPITKVKKWEFENIWGVGSLFALLILPWPLVLFYVNDLAALYANIPDHVFYAVILSGIAWGIGGIYWGKAINIMGVSLGVTILMGLINVFGSIVPLATFEPSKIFTPGGYMLIIAVVTLIIGILITSIAGQKKEKSQNSENIELSKSSRKSNFKMGLVICLISGILSAGVNFSFIFGAPITNEAIALNVPDFATSFAIWSLVFTANFSINTIYGFYMMIKNGTLKNLRKGSFSREWLGAIFMGLAWPGGIIIYGIGANEMGSYGAYVGFPMMILASILAGNLAGAINGEWKNSGASARRIMLVGVLVLFIAFTLLGYSTFLMNNA
jgi:L-rhamnose-H+ transport protein